MEKSSITNEQLGAVYLKIDGLDKERFKKLTEGMKFYSTVEQELNDGYSYIEYFGAVGGFEWLSTGSTDEDAQLITLDELEERLFPKGQPKTFKVTRQALGEIYEAVCQEWRDTITLLLERQKFNSDIEVNEDLVKKAHVQSSSAHNPKVVKEWLDKYLPLPKKKKIEIVEVKEGGFWTRATLENSTPFNDLKSWENIVLIKENFKDGLDLIMCYGQPSNTYACNHFLGHFNEGNLED